MLKIYFLIAIFCGFRACEAQTWHQLGSYEYFFEENTAMAVRSYAVAETRCSNEGATLAVVNTQEINDFLVNTIGTVSLYPAFYIGLQRLSSDRFDLQWVDGTHVMDGFSNWRSPEPTGNDCVIMGWIGAYMAGLPWYTFLCTSGTPLRYICQRSLAAETTTTSTTTTTTATTTSQPTTTTSATTTTQPTTTTSAATTSEPSSTTSTTITSEPFSNTSATTTSGPSSTTYTTNTTSEPPTTPVKPTTGMPQLQCPEPANACSRRSAWLCDYIQWRVTFMNDWIRIFSQSRDLVTGEIPREGCRHLNVSCKNQGQNGSVFDPNGCEIPYCKDGYYNDMQVMDDWVADSRLWRRYFEAWKRALAQTPAQECN